MMHGVKREAVPMEKQPLLLYGARDKPSLYLRDALEELPLQIRVSTEDGSEGVQGLVTALLAEALDGLDPAAGARVFACGPDPMMRAVSTLCAAKRIECYLSLEGRMACGIGVCNGCAVEVEKEGKKSYERVCYEGPVFKASLLPFYCNPEPRPGGEDAPSAGP
jgi:dihydroorotate dehydrogenase electron transfer subunit